MWKVRMAAVAARRGISTTNAQRQALPAVAPATTKGGSLLSWLFGNSKSATPLTPLYDPLSGVRVPPNLPDQVTPEETKITTLPNGFKIASEQISGPTATIGIYIDSGSVYEDPTNFGTTHLLERMAFKSTANRSHFQLVREVEALGGYISANATREHMVYSADAIKTYMPEMVEILIDSVRNPVFYAWEVKEQIARVKAEIAEASNNPQGLVVEALHSAGYVGALGHHLLASESAVCKLDSSVLLEFVMDNYTAPRMILSASGVDHNELVSVAEPLLSDMAKVPLQTPPRSQYVGGDWRQSADSTKTHVALAFEVPGGWCNEKDIINLTVLQVLLGGGSSFSSGGPGKGMYSRLYARVLNKFDGVQSLTAFSNIYNNTGLFGVHGTCGPEFVSSLVDIACHQLIDVATPGEVASVELERAKNATISAVLMNLELKVVVAEDIGRQILSYGHRKSLDGFIEQVKAVTLQDITEISATVLSTPLTMVSWGNVSDVPRLDDVSSRFN